MENNYELMLLVKSSLSEAKQKELIKKTEEIILKEAKKIKTEVIGKKHLAYPIKKEKDAIFILMTLAVKQEDNTIVKQATAKLKLNEDIIRFLFIRKG